MLAIYIAQHQTAFFLNIKYIDPAHANRSRYSNFSCGLRRCRGVPGPIPAEGQVPHRGTETNVRIRAQGSETS